MINGGDLNNPTYIQAETKAENRKYGRVKEKILTKLEERYGDKNKESVTEITPKEEPIVPEEIEIISDIIKEKIEMKKLTILEYFALQGYNKEEVKEIIEELTDKVDTEEFFIQSIDAMSQNGKLYAIPRDLSFFVFYVNTDLVNLPPNNWRLEDLIKFSKSDKLKNRYTIGYEKGIYYALPYLKYFGGGILNDLGEEIINTENSLAGIKFYKELKDKYKIAPQESDIGSMTVAQMFLNQKIAFYLSGRWIYPKISEKASFNWAVVNFPYGKLPIPCDTSGWAVSKNSKHKETAIDFAKFLSNEKNSKYFTETGLIIPANKKASLLLEDKKHNEKIFIEAISHSKNTIVNRNFNRITDRINIDYDL